MAGLLDRRDDPLRGDRPAHLPVAAVTMAPGGGLSTYSLVRDRQEAVVTTFRIAMVAWIIAVVVVIAALLLYCAAAAAVGRILGRNRYPDIE